MSGDVQSMSTSILLPIFLILWTLMLCIRRLLFARMFVDGQGLAEDAASGQPMDENVELRKQSEICVWFWSDLTEDVLEKHILYIIGKANRTVGFLSRNLRDCTPPVKDDSTPYIWVLVNRLVSPPASQHQDFGASPTENGTLCLQRLLFTYPRMCHKDAWGPQLGTTGSSEKTWQAQHAIQNWAQSGRYTSSERRW